MYYKISLIFLFALFIIIHSENVTNDPACTDEQNFGPNVFCMLAYKGYVNETYLHEDFPDAEYFGIAKVPKHRFDFGYSAAYDSYEPTIVPDECETAYAVAYLLNSSFFNSVLETLTLSCCGEQYKHSVKTAVQVTGQQEKKLDVYCNMFVNTVDPEKVKPLPLNRRPAECYLAWLVEIYRNAGLPEEYVNNIANTETNPDLTCED